jgi:Domain of unknown function (DUF4406)
MILVYIAGPFTAPDVWGVECNIRQAEEWGFKIARCGFVPVIPHTMYRFFHGTITEKFWYMATLELMERCDAVLLIPGWQESKGAEKEKETAEILEIPIYYELRNLKEDFGRDSIE